MTDDDHERVEELRRQWGTASGIECTSTQDVYALLRALDSAEKRAQDAEREREFAILSGLEIRKERDEAASRAQDAERELSERGTQLAGALTANGLVGEHAERFRAERDEWRQRAIDCAQQALDLVTEHDRFARELFEATQTHMRVEVRLREGYDAATAEVERLRAERDEYRAAWLAERKSTT